VAKKFFLSILVLLFLVNTVIAVDIGYVVKTAYPINTDESSIIALLENNGHNVSFLDDDNIINPDLYDLMIIGEDITNIDELFDNKNHKTLFLSYIAAKNAGLSQYSGTTTNNKINIASNSNRITQDFATGEIKVYESSDTVNYLYGCKPINSEKLANKLYEDDKIILLVLRENSLLLKDNLCTKRNIPISERNLFFGLPKASSWNSDSEDLFINSINWLIEGEDKDKDGYFYNDDCDDNNADKYQFIEGYLDSDKDSYGTGNLLQVCSGDELPTGYSEIDTDCNDTDPNKYQFIEGYIDNDNDGYGSAELLEVCSGNELLEGYSEINNDCDDIVASCNLDCSLLKYSDSDSDGYGNPLLSQRECDAPANYVDDNTDCNDTNPSINPDANEMQYDMIDSNCDDSAEFSSEIPDIFWNEDTNLTIDLNSYVWNPNNNELEFYIYATSNDKHIFIKNQGNGIINFSSQKDWWGDDWVVFLIVDGQTYLETNEIKLIVNPVNDAPEFQEQIENITWNEDTNLTDYLDLNYYFYDVDEDELSYDFEVLGDIFINIIINNNLVSFYPDKDGHGIQKIIFSANDGSETTQSNEIILTVNDMNEPPEFDEITCQTKINEDQEYSCELSATDFENNTLLFSVVDENDLNCNINENKLEYQSIKDYNGEASCLIRVSDGTGYDEYSLEVNILLVNDEPIITDYSPKGAIKLMENTNKTFSITTSDIDGDILGIQWFLDDILIANQTNTYILNKPKGNYKLKAVVSDQELNATKIFNVFVGSISDFTCQEVGGYVLAENQICLGELLSVKDINNCCSIQGSPKFSETDRCKILNNSINIEIKEPDENKQFTIGDKISFNIEVQNNLKDDFDFDIRAYLYDLTDDNKIEDYKKSININQGDTKEINSEFKVSEDLDETHKYAVFVRAIEDKDELACNENYVSISFERQEHDVIIQNLDINPTELTCGDYFNVDVNLKNRGTSDEDVSIFVGNTELGIKEQTPNFVLEKYSDKDTTNRFFSIKTPENIESGKYDIKISAEYDNGNKADTVSKEISIDCKKIEQKTQEIEKISLQTQNQESQTKDNPNVFVVLIIMFALFIILIVIYLFNLIFIY